MNPTLADDEAQLAEYAQRLSDALSASLHPWLCRVGRDCLGRADPEIEAAARKTADTLGPTIRRILLADVDAGAGSPLATIRAGTGRFSAALRAAGASLPVRDPFAVEHFPDDLFDIGPASFADIDESLHELGLMWGAARAHVHLRRRREADT